MTSVKVEVPERVKAMLVWSWSDGGKLDAEMFFSILSHEGVTIGAKQASELIEELDEWLFAA